MSDRLVKYLENGRIVTRGVHRIGADTLIFQDKNDTLKYTYDFAGWLDSDTISSVTIDSNGPTVASANTTTTVTITLSAVNGDGDFTIRITTAAGLIKDFVTQVREREEAYSTDYA